MAVNKPINQQLNKKRMKMLYWDFCDDLLVFFLCECDYTRRVDKSVEADLTKLHKPELLHLRILRMQIYSIYKNAQRTSACSRSRHIIHASSCIRTYTCMHILSRSTRTTRTHTHARTHTHIAEQLNNTITTLSSSNIIER